MKLFLLLLISIWTVAVIAIWEWEKSVHSPEGQAQDPRGKLAYEYLQLGQFAEAYKLFQELSVSYPENTEFLFHAGRLGVWLLDWASSELLLKQCLAVDETHVEAATQLGNLYLYNQRWSEAEEAFAKCPDYAPAQKGLAKCALWKGDYPLAEERYRKLQSQSALDEEGRLGFARSLAAQQKYAEADVQYNLLTQPDFEGTILAPERIAIASRTKISLLADVNYMQSKESDPQLKAPVAKDYGLATSLSLLFPLADQWRLDTRLAFYHQKEDNIYPPARGINYNALLGEATVASRFFFKPDWRWDLYTKVISGWKDGSMTFPFQHKVFFEPGTTLFYNSKKQFFVLNGFCDTFLIKNYAKGISQLLFFTTVETGYAYRFDVRYQPELEGRVAESFIRDSFHNVQNRQDLWFRTGLPLLPKMFSVIYHFEHAGFTHLSPNYYSYKNKWFQGLGLRLYQTFCTYGYIDLNYEHTWDLTLKLLQPIGTFIYVAGRQYLNGNSAYSALGYAKDRYQVELSGHYFHNNLPYSDWNAKASFRWQF